MNKKQIFFIFCILIILLVIIGTIVALNNKETFVNSPLGSMGGFGFTKENGPQGPLFLNFYPKQLGTDFYLQNILRKLKLSIVDPTVFNGFQNGNPVNMGADKTPIIIVPSIGASKIFATWNKTNNFKYVKKVDSYGNFEESSKWKCKDIQDTWTPIWFPDSTDGLSEYCWKDNVSVKVDTMAAAALDNFHGVNTMVDNVGTLDFIDNAGYNTLIKALVSDGYVPGTTLFGFNYDFRLMSTDEIVTLLSNFVDKLTIGGKKVILLGHGLGSCVINYTLSKQNDQWKSKNISSFISISGAFGGCPKALRTLLSGENRVDKLETKLIRDASANFAGIYWMLPNPIIYGNGGNGGGAPLILHNAITYTSGDIPTIISKVSKDITGDDSMSTVYSKVSSIINDSLKAPGVPTFILAGTDIPTESNYTYAYEMTDAPVEYNKLYSIDLANTQGREYKSLYNGDGTMPQRALEYPLTWATQNPVYYRFYENAEHVRILSMADPVMDLLSIVNSQ